jgi:2-polyprenyl-6-methoxyphenol hydroxylase-like FAD-dependent oxidoreductase
VDVRDRPDGASIGLTGRAVDALEELGLLGDCADAGNVLRDSVFARMYDQAGRPLPGPPPVRADDRLPAAIVIHRAELARILRSHAERNGASVRIGTTAAALEQGPDQVEVTFTHGATGTYDLVVGADGVHSRIRGLVHPNLAPRYTGHMSLRWLLTDGPTGEPGFYNSPQSVVIVGRLPGDLTYVSTGADLPNTRITPEQARQEMRRCLAPFTAPYLRELHARCDDTADIIVRPYEWLLVPPPWHRGRVTLIGDAAHATTAHLSSGGAMALEDAVVLARELTRTPDLDQALDAFMNRRIDRVRTVVETSVELLAMDQRHEHPRVLGMTRAKAMSLLASPY